MLDLQFPAWQWVIGVLSLVVAFWCGWPSTGRRSGPPATARPRWLRSSRWACWRPARVVPVGASTGGQAISDTPCDGHSRPRRRRPAHLYFESSAMIVTFLLIGRWRRRARGAAPRTPCAPLALGAHETLLIRRADSHQATAETTTAVEELIDVADLRVGDVFASGQVRRSPPTASSSRETPVSMPRWSPADRRRSTIAAGDQVTGATSTSTGSLDDARNPRGRGGRRSRRWAASCQRRQARRRRNASRIASRPVSCPRSSSLHF